MEKDEEIINVKIKTLESQININIKKNATLLELKEKINRILNIPTLNQRLIYQGKILQNNSEKIKHYKISNDCVIHLVTRKLTTSDDNNQNNNNNNNININLNEENNSENSPGGNNGLGFIRMHHNSNRRLQRKIMHFDPSDCIETLYQNILVINNLMKIRNNFTMSNFLQNKTIIPFNLSKKKFEIGEWVDVKDTTDNWLEGQIINKRTINNKTQLLIHYNGWGNRWDEWIDQSSNRLSFFRTYTLQSIQSVLLSPNPTLVSDGNIINDNNPKRPVDLFFYFNKVSNIINEINKIIEKMNNFKKRDNLNIEEEKDDVKEHKEHKEKDKDNYLNMNNFIPFSFNELEIIQMTSQLIPILDRCGRLMSDLSLLLSHTIFNPNLYPHLLLGHINEISDSMSCTSGYSMLTNESNSILSGLTSNFRFRQEKDVLNNLRPINRTSNLTRGNINNFSQNNNINNNNINNINNIKTISINKNSSNNNNNQNNNTNQFSRPHYIINSSNAELPFIQRLNFNNNMHQNYFININSNQNLFDTFPKINLQIPPLLSPNQNSLIQQNGMNSLEEQNNIFLLNNHIFVENTNNNINNLNYINIRNNNIERNQVQNDIVSEDNNYEQLNNNLNNTFNKNFKSLYLPMRKNSANSCKTNKSADQMYTSQYKQFKIYNERNDLMKNLNKDTTGFYDNLSIKSDKILPLKNKNFSYKSVSEVDEFGEYQQKNNDEEEDLKKKDNNTYTTSRKSVESGFFFEEENSTGINNINLNNNINTNNNNSNINIMQNNNNK